MYNNIQYLQAILAINQGFKEKKIQGIQFRGGQELKDASIQYLKKF